MAKKDENQLDLLDQVNLIDLQPPSGVISLNYRASATRSGYYVIRGRKGKQKKGKPFCRIYAGNDDDPIGRTKDVQRDDTEAKYKALVMLNPAFTFSLVFVDQNKTETDITEYVQ